VGERAREGRRSAAFSGGETYSRGFHSVFFWRKKFVKKATCKMIPRIYSSKTTRVLYITFESTRDAFRHSDESVMISNVGIHSKRNLEFSAEVSISSAHSRGQSLPPSTLSTTYENTCVGKDIKEYYKEYCRSRSRTVLIGGPATTFKRRRSRSPPPPKKRRSSVSFE
jgi:hypothetical protein